jgi:hypothetical protein
MFLLRQILPATIIAMMVAGSICGVAFLTRKEAVRTLLASLALGAAYAAGHIFITGWPSFPPKDTTNWLPYFAVIAAVLGAFWTTSNKKRWIIQLTFAVFCAGALCLLLRPKFQYGWSLVQGSVWVFCLTIVVLFVALILEMLFRRSTLPIEVPILLLIVSGGTFGSLLLSGSMLLGQFAAVLSAALFGTLILGVRQKVRCSIPVFSLIEAAILLCGFFFASLPAISGALLALAPVVALIPLDSSRRYSALAIRAILIIVPVAVALIVAFRASPPLDY